MFSNKLPAVSLVFASFIAADANASSLDFFNSKSTPPSVEINLGALNNLSTLAPHLTPEQAQEFAYIPPPPRAPQTAPEIPQPNYQPPPQKAALPEEKSSLAEKLDGEFSGNIGLTNDYSFRGVTQNNNRPAVQGNLDFKHASGFKIGTWASNVNFSGNASLETDFYAAYVRDVELPYLGGLATETGVIYYAYPGAKKNFNYDYTELYTNFGYDLGFATLGASFNYSPNFTLDSGAAYYPKLSFSAPLPYNFALDGWVGHQLIEDNTKAGLPDYTDYALGLAYSYDDFTIKGQYIDTDIRKSECLNGCGAKGIVTVSKSFK